MKVENIGTTQGVNNTQFLQKNSMPETSFAELINQAKTEPNQQQSQTDSKVDLSKYDKYYNDEFYKYKAADDGTPNFYTMQRNGELDSIRPEAHGPLGDGSMLYFPAKDAPDEVKAAYFEALEKMTPEERGKVGADVLVHFLAKTKSFFNDVTKEDWDAYMGHSNVSYQGFFKELTEHFKNRIAESSDPELIAKLKVHLNAHQTILDTFIEHGIE